MTAPTSLYDWSNLVAEIMLRDAKTAHDLPHVRISVTEIFCTTCYPELSPDHFKNFWRE
jgi:hypothetical protein